MDCLITSLKQTDSMLNADVAEGLIREMQKKNPLADNVTRRTQKIYIYNRI